MHIVRGETFRETRQTPLHSKLKNTTCSQDQKHQSTAQKSAQNTLTTLLSFVWPLRISFLRPSPAESLRCCRLDLSIPRPVLPLIFSPRLVSLAPPIVRLFLGLKDAMQNVQRRNLEKEFREGI